MTDKKDTEDDADRIDIPDGTLVYGNKNVEVGVDEDGNGYLTIKKPLSEFEYTFTVPREQVEELAAQQSRNAPPGPTPPEGTLDVDDIDIPDGFEGGRVVHTGGNIWNRIFTRELPGDGRIEVGYNPRDSIQGVSAGVYGPKGDWRGELAVESLRDDATEKDAVAAARGIMTDITSGGYEDKIDELLSDS